VDSANVRLECLDVSIRIVCEKRDQAFQLWKRGKAPSETLEIALKTMTSDLMAVKSDLEDQNWGDDAATAEHQRIVSIIKTVVDRTQQNLDMKLQRKI